MQRSPILLDYRVVHFKTDSQYRSVYLIFTFNVNSGGAAVWILLYSQQMQVENEALTKKKRQEMWLKTLHFIFQSLKVFVG